MQVQPYLNFNGRCEEAIDFYKSALGATVQMLVRFKESPEPPPGGRDPSVDNKVMHATLRIGDSTVLASDGRCQGTTSFSGISLTLAVPSDDEAQQCFKALSQGGNVTMPLTKTFFSSNFGMVTDRFGLPWMVIVQH